MELKDLKVRLGEENLSYKKAFKWKELSYSDIRHAYLRVEEVNAKMCCGRANFDMIFLMLQTDSLPDPLKLPITKIEKGKEMLSLIHRKNPETKIGYYNT